MMEKNGVFTITFSPRKNWLLMGVLIFWLLLWGGVLAAVAHAVLRGQIEEVGFFVIFFLLVWLGGWSLGGGLALYGLLWMGFGSERIDIGPEQITMTRMIPGYQRVNSYAKAEIRSLRLVETGQGLTDWLLSLRPFGIGNGLLSFDCRARVVTFAEGIDREQAASLLEEIRAALQVKEGHADV